MCAVDTGAISFTKANSYFFNPKACRLFGFWFLNKTYTVKLHWMRPVKFTQNIRKLHSKPRNLKRENLHEIQIAQKCLDLIQNCIPARSALLKAAYPEALLYIFLYTGAIYKRRRNFIGHFWYPPSPMSEFWPWFT